MISNNSTLVVFDGDNFDDVVNWSLGIVGIPIYVLIYVIVYSTAAVVGSVGNVLVILTLLFTKVLRQTRNAFIVSLAIADFMVSAVTMPASVVGILAGKAWMDNYFAMCSFTSTMCAPGCVASMHCIAWIAISRYYYIGQYAKFQKYFTRKKIVVYLSFIWLLSFGVHLPNRFGWGSVHYSFVLRYCTLDTDTFSYATFYASVLVSAIVAAFFFYGRIYLVLRNSTLSKKMILGGAAVAPVAPGLQPNAQQQQQQHNDKKQQTAFANEVKIIKTSFKIFILFFVSWLPICILLLMNAGAAVPAYVYLYAAMLAHCNSTLNFVVYFMENDLFRKSLKVLFYKMSRKRAVAPTTVGQSTKHAETAA